SPRGSRRVVEGSEDRRSSELRGRPPTAPGPADRPVPPISPGTTIANMTIEFTKLGGWRHDPWEVRRTLASLRRPYFAASAPGLARSGADRTTLLYKAFEEVNGGRYIDYPAQ